MKTKAQFIIIILCITFLGCKKDDNTEDTNITIENQEEEPTNNETISNWYKVNELQNKTFIIEEPESSQANVSYLLVGDDKALMFDMGSGENKPENGTKIKHVLD